MATASKVKLLSAVPVLPVMAIAPAVDFYKAKLGFRPLFVMDDYAGLARDQIELHLWDCKDPKLPKVSSCRVMVKGIKELYAEAQAQGIVHPNGALSDQPWGTREFVALDLDGNAIRFAEELNPGLA